MKTTGGEDIGINTALVDVYTKIGDAESALQIFAILEDYLCRGTEGTTGWEGQGVGGSGGRKGWGNSWLEFHVSQ